MKDHMRNIYKNILTRSEIVKNVFCIMKFDNVKKWKISEALIIFREKPNIKRQNEDFKNVLKLYYWFIFQCKNNIIIVFVIYIIPEVFIV